MSTGGASKHSGRGRARIVPNAERTAFVEAVLAGDLTPDITAVAYHFSGSLDEDVVQAVFEVSSDPSEAVSALAGLSRSAEKPTDDDQERSASPAPAAPGGGVATTFDNETAAIMMDAKGRHARTLEAIQAQTGSSIPSAAPFATPAARGDGEAKMAAATPPPPPSATPPGTPVSPPATTSASDEEAGLAPAANGDDCGCIENADLEKVAAVITTNAGEEEGADIASRAPTKPPEPLFFVPQGISAPSTRTAQLVIVNTAEKTVELPGFEAFMKMQHGKNKLFRFLAVDHNLHSYYLLAKQHAREAAMKGGKAKGVRAPAVPVKASRASTARGNTEDAGECSTSWNDSHAPVSAEEKDRCQYPLHRPLSASQYLLPSVERALVVVDVAAGDGDDAAAALSCLFCRALWRKVWAV